MATRRGRRSARARTHPAAPNAAGAIGAFAEQAVDGGTRRLVLLSDRGEEAAQRSELSRLRAHHRGRRRLGRLTEPRAMSGVLFAATLVTALACGLIAGVFFAFSTFVMKALARLPPDQGIAAMQAINTAAVTPMFIAALLGTAVACAGLITAAVVIWGERPAVWLLAGGALYLAGTLLLTVVYHVPRNNALAEVDPHAPDASGHWTRYVTDWTSWNHVRGAAALVAAGLLSVALSVG